MIYEFPSTRVFELSNVVQNDAKEPPPPSLLLIAMLSILEQVRSVGMSLRIEGGRAR